MSFFPHSMEKTMEKTTPHVTRRPRLDPPNGGAVEVLIADLLVCRMPHTARDARPPSLPCMPFRGGSVWFAVRGGEGVLRRCPNNPPYKTRGKSTRAARDV